ncbi:54S ribosomal protein img2, mitochondrial [Sorochytrium milnesiophthora]
MLRALVRPLSTAAANVAVNAARYFVSRTASKRLPVYTEFRNGNRVLTIVRRIQGDSKVLASDLRPALVEAKIDVSPTSGNLIVKGNHADAIRRWLAEKGF